MIGFGSSASNDRRSRRLLTSLVSMSVFAVATAAATMAGDLPVQLVHQEGGTTLAAAMSGGRLYLAVGPRLIIEDISDPASPIRLGQSEVLAGPGYDLAVSGNHAYFLSRFAGLEILDVSDPASPTRLGFCPLDGDNRAIAVSGCFAYAYDSGGLRVVDVTNPANPVKRGHCSLSCSCFSGLTASGDYVYAADGTSLYIIDVSDPQTPCVAFTSSMVHPQRVAVSGQYAYIVSYYSAGLQVLDISDPTAPLLVAQRGSVTCGEDISITGNYACVQDLRAGLMIFDISDPSSPVLLASYEEDPIVPYRVATEGNYCTALQVDGKVRALDLTRLTSPLRVGAGDGPAPGVSVATSQGYAYVGGDETFYVVDISNPASPVTVGESAYFGGSPDIAVSGTLAALAQPSGLGLMDISNPSAPTPVAYYNTAQSPFAVAMLDPNICVMDRRDDLLIINVSDPAAPVQIGELQIGKPMLDIAIAGHFAYVANECEGLKIVDLSDPTAPVLAGEWTGGKVSHVVVQGTRAYLLTTSYGDQMVVLDVSNPGTPVLLATLSEPSDAVGLAVRGSEAFLISDYGNGSANEVLVMDISDLANPRSTGVYRTENRYQGIQAADDYLYVVGYDFDGGGDELEILDISKPGPPWLSEYNPGPPVSGVAAAGQFAYWVSSRSGLRIMDLSLTGGFEFIGSYQGAEPVSAAVSGNLTVLATWATGVEIVDVSDPHEPVRLGGIDTDGYARDVVVDGHYAYVADDMNGVQIIDIADPVSPVLVGGVGEHNLGSRAQAVAVSGGYVFVADEDSGLQILDISNPVSPFRVGGCDTPGNARDVAASGPYAYVADSSGGLLIFDVSNPASPSLVHQDTSGGHVDGVTVTGSRAYVTSDLNGLEVFDVSHPAQPVRIAQYGLDYSGEVSIAGEYVLLADWLNGLYILHISPRSDFDADGDVDGDDLDLFETCASGPGIAPASGCEGRDLDGDGDVDQSDFGLMQRCLSGSGVLADMDCGG